MDFSAAVAYNPDKAPARPYVQFELRAMEDRSVTAADGVTHTKDVAWATVRAPGSMDSVEKVAEEWLDGLTQHAKNGRIPISWPGEYREAFRLWKAGEEVPPIGTAIKTWPPLSPAQRKNVLAAGVLTVEDLAAANDESKTRIGMGALTLVHMAKAWLADASRGATSQALEAALVKLASLEELVQEQKQALEEARAATKGK